MTSPTQHGFGSFSRLGAVVAGVVLALLLLAGGALAFGTSGHHGALGFSNGAANAGSMMSWADGHHRQPDARWMHHRQLDGACLQAHRFDGRWNRAHHRHWSWMRDHRHSWAWMRAHHDDWRPMMQGRHHPWTPGPGDRG